MALSAIQPHRAITILVVDDCKSMRDVIAFTVSGKGYGCELADSGEAALALARSKSFDLIMTDINMPGMDGFTLTRELRKLKNHKHTPILVLTTECSHDMRQEGRVAGATGWIIKPFDSNKLINAIEKVTS